MSVNALMISADILKERMAIHDNIDEKLLYPDIKVAQDMYIHPILGTALFDKIIGDIDSTGTTTGNYKILLDKFIIDALCYYTMSRLPVAISFQFWNKGVVRKTGDNLETVDMVDLVTLSDRYLKTAEWYGERLTKYLQQSISSSGAQMFPEYSQPGNGIDTLIPEPTAFTMPVYLGDQYDPSLDKNNCHPIGCRTNQRDLNI